MGEVASREPSVASIIAEQNRAYEESLAQDRAREEARMRQQREEEERRLQEESNRNEEQVVHETTSESPKPMSRQDLAAARLKFFETSQTTSQNHAVRSAGSGE